MSCILKLVEMRLWFAPYQTLVSGTVVRLAAEFCVLTRGSKYCSGLGAGNTERLGLFQ